MRQCFCDIAILSLSRWQWPSSRMTIVALRMEKAYHLANCGHSAVCLSVLGLICRLLSAAASWIAIRIREAIYRERSAVSLMDEGTAEKKRVGSVLIISGIKMIKFRYDILNRTARSLNSSIGNYFFQLCQFKLLNKSVYSLADSACVLTFSHIQIPATKVV